MEAVLDINRGNARGRSNGAVGIRSAVRRSYGVAGQILRRKLFTLLGENDLGDNATGSDPSSMSSN